MYSRPQFTRGVGILSKEHLGTVKEDQAKVAGLWAPKAWCPLTKPSMSGSVICLCPSMVKFLSDIVLHKALTSVVSI
jgi:hypothetical protein